MTHPQHVGGLEIRIDGTPLDPTVSERLIDVRVQDDLQLPDTAQLRFRDPDFQLVDGTTIDVGRTVELRMSTPSSRSAARTLFTGEVASLAPEFEAGGCVFVVRAFDVSHRLNRVRRSRTFQDMTASDIARKVIAESGLPCEISATREVAAFQQQSDETDWAFLWRLAERAGYTLSCVDGTMRFRPADRPEDSSARVEWGHGLRSFHPRATAVQQVKEVEISSWDPATARRVTGVASTATLDSSIGLDRARTTSQGGSPRLVVSDRVVTTQGEADQLAQSTLDQLANAWLEAEGAADGNPQLRAGSLVEVTGVGKRFGGKYLITSATHVVRGGRGYETQFRVSGRARRALLDLLTPAASSRYGEALVIGQVTNVDDPKGQNRVRVKFPALGDGHEGWWARVASLAATGNRGVMMHPLVGDEVVIGFEQGDERRPIVLGALWNGTKPPGDLVRNTKSGGARNAPDGSFNLVSQKAVTVRATEEVDVASKSYGLATTADAALDANGKARLTAKGDLLLSGGGKVTVHGDGSVSIDSRGPVKISGASIDISASGTVNIHGASVSIG
jgi:phage protein D